MSDRDRLIELLRKVDNMRLMRKGFTECADYLIANGVIVPPCKVGDKIYTVGVFSGQIVACEVVAIINTKSECFLHLENETVVFVREQLGKTVFLTKEEAEAKLKECEGKWNYM